MGFIKKRIDLYPIGRCYSFSGMDSNLSPLAMCGQYWNCRLKITLYTCGIAYHSALFSFCLFDKNNCVSWFERTWTRCICVITMMMTLMRLRSCVFMPCVFLCCMWFGVPRRRGFWHSTLKVWTLTHSHSLLLCISVIIVIVITYLYLVCFLLNSSSAIHSLSQKSKLMNTVDVLYVLSCSFLCLLYCFIYSHRVVPWKINFFLNSILLKLSLFGS